MGLLRTYRPFGCDTCGQVGGQVWPVPDYPVGPGPASLAHPAGPQWPLRAVRRRPVGVDTDRIAESVVYFGTASFHERAGIPLSAT